MSEIRKTLAAAQRAETKGDMSEAKRLLRFAAEYYDERGMAARAQQMLRHAERLDGPVERQPTLSLTVNEVLSMGDTSALPTTRVAEPADDGFGFGDALLAVSVAEPRANESAPPIGRPPKRSFPSELRGPVLCSPSESAWCSFCCQPGSDVGRLVMGPAEAFICAACASSAHSLITQSGAKVPEVSEAVLEKLNRLSRLAEESGRLAGELTTLVARIPDEGYEPS
jgi:hypothetical protein